MASVARGFRKLYVSNLPWSVGHTELRDFFRQFGRVVSANVIFDKTDGCSRGYGFVTFEDDNNGQLLNNLENNNNLFLEGNYLAIQPTNEY